MPRDEWKRAGHRVRYGQFRKFYKNKPRTHSNQKAKPKSVAAPQDRFKSSVQNQHGPSLKKIRKRLKVGPLRKWHDQFILRIEPSAYETLRNSASKLIHLLMPPKVATDDFNIFMIRRLYAGNTESQVIKEAKAILQLK